MIARRFLTLLCLLSACALALAACGDSGDGGGEATASSVQVPEQMEGAVRAALVNPEFEVETVKTTGLTVDGKEATVEAELTGGTIGGQSVAVVLVKDGKRWKAKKVAKFTKLDRPLLDRLYELETKSIQGLTGAQARCLTEEFESSSQAEIEAMYLDHEKAAFKELGKRCKDA